MKTLIEERFLVPPFYVFFLIYSSQMGVVGILNFQKEIIEGAGYDAWIAVLLSGVSIHLLVWMVYRILKISNWDITYINSFCFGTWIGRLLNFLIILYFVWSIVIVFRTYIEIVQVWMFPSMKIWQISLVSLILIYYIVTSGFRVITGVCFWGTAMKMIILYPLLFFALEFTLPNQLFPLFNHSVQEIFISTKTMTFQFLGIETLFMFYPFIKNPEKSQKWAHFSVLFLIFIYLLVTIISFVYFTEEHLKHLIWPTLTLLKIAQFPVLERVEYIVVSIYFLIVLPNISLRLWVACRCAKKLIPIKQRFILLFILALIFFLSSGLDTHRIIRQYTDLYAKVGFYFLYGYIPLLFLAIHLKQKITQRVP
ncbi:GerAB/ArcD/ProY family transporter [Ammoniphilus sp. YIM 78166]|uniref:GerAB/ArcD/ProY family transporter n=1 Tax=Ammoniphilus sp. YIM 78166 TaxID=1644106 RepID=UPI001F0F960D|nr:GerAB/ArcD/ProY family transporter [Ammoniphilus sp. YIM 78166]